MRSKAALSRYLLEAARDKPPVRVVENPIPALSFRPAHDFNVYAPGMLVFAILLLIPQTALLVGREMRRGTLRRLRAVAAAPVANCWAESAWRR